MAKSIGKAPNREEEVGVKTSMVVKPSLFDKIKFIALVDKRSLSSILEEALNDFITKWEKKTGRKADL